MRAMRIGAPVLVLGLLAAGAAGGQEAMPVLPDIVAPGAPAVSAGSPPIPEEDAVTSPPGHGTESRAVAETMPADEALPAEPPSGGSRLLRALAEASVGRERASEGAARPGTAGAAPLFAAEGCPRALLRRLLAGAAGEADAVAALAVETELLTLCRERQGIVTALLETEARLRELRAAAVPPAVETAVETAPSVPAPAAAAAEPEPTPDPGPAEAVPAPSALRQSLAAAREPQPGAAPALGWFSIVGSVGALRAGITDGAGVWFVREGDALPGGGTVAAIAGRPPGVHTTGPEGNGESLPFRPRPGGLR